VVQNVQLRIDEDRGFESYAGHSVVFLGKTIYSDFLSPPRFINGYLILFRIGEGKDSEGGDWHHPHYAGPEKSEMLNISLTYIVWS